jgi:hypothetical protein
MSSYSLVAYDSEDNDSDTDAGARIFFLSWIQIHLNVLPTEHGNENYWFASDHLSVLIPTVYGLSSTSKTRRSDRADASQRREQCVGRTRARPHDCDGGAPKTAKNRERR